MIGESDDMGISLGRNLALKMVKTKYFLLVDDDHVFNDKTNLDKVNQSDSSMIHEENFFSSIGKVFQNLFASPGLPCTEQSSESSTTDDFCYL